MRRWSVVLGTLLAWLALPATARAHVGAPYPVLLEEPVGPYLTSALADPDVGQGTFYVMVALPDGQPLPSDTAVSVSVAPEDRHVAEVGYAAQRQQTRYGERFVAEVPFDTKGTWQVRLVIEGSAGLGEISFPVEVTPSGVGLLASLACLVPFVILGGLWLRGARRQRSSR